MEDLERHENLNAQPEKLQELLETPRRCILLSPKLTLQQRRGIAREHYVVTVEHEAEPHHAVICGFYRHSHNAEVERTAREEWEELAEVPQPNTGEFQEGIVASQAPRIDIAREDFLAELLSIKFKEEDMVILSRYFVAMLAVLITLPVIAQPDTTDPSLILYVSFDELQGGQVPDESLHGNHGTIIGTPTLVPGKFGKAIELNGATDWIEIPHHESLTVETAVTVMCWIHTPRFGTGGLFQPWQAILTKGDRPRSYSFYTESGSDTAGNIYPYGETLHLSVNDWFGSNSRGKLKPNVWQHVVAQVDNGVHRYWINGEDAGVVAYTSDFETNADPWLPGNCDKKPVRIGNSHEPARQFLGKIDEVRIWNRALSGDEIKAEMNQGLAPEAAVDLKFDLNGDGVVDLEDVKILAGLIGQEPVPAEADFNNDAVIDIRDIIQIVSYIREREKPDAPPIRDTR